MSTEVYNLVRNVQRDYPRLRALVNQAMEFGLEETDVAALQVAARWGRGKCISTSFDRRYWDSGSRE